MDKHSIRMARNNLQAGNHRIAKQMFRQILDADGEATEAWRGLAQACQSLGDHQGAVNAYLSILKIHPADVEALHALARLYHLQGELVAAEECLRRSLALDANSTGTLNQLGIMLRVQGRLDEAASCFRQALAVDPNRSDLLNNFGNVLRQMGDFAAAKTSYDAALKIRPDFPDALSNLGAVLVKLGRYQEAASHCQAAIAIQPDHLAAICNLASSLQAQDQLEAAADACRRALEICPDSIDATCCLGIVLRRQGHLDAAESVMRRAVQLQPASAMAWNNLAAILRRQGQLAQAEETYRRALQLRPRYGVALNGLGVTLVAQGRIQEAAAAFEKAVEFLSEDQQPQNVDGQIPDWAAGGAINDDGARQPRIGNASLSEVRRNQGVVSLLMGHFEQGWSNYEWRRQSADYGLSPLAGSFWKGESLIGKTILLSCEQGMGDTIQFIRYASELKRLGGTVIAQVQKPLSRLLSSCVDVDEIICEDGSSSQADFQIPMLSVPHILKTTLESIPRSVPYLFPDESLVTRWRRELEQYSELKIGVAFQGNSIHPNDAQRSIPFHHFRRIAEIPGVRLFSLQKGYGEEQVDALATEFEVVKPGPQFDVDSGPFMDTAAIMQCLDLIITADTCPAHLAGALGVPVWVGLPYSPDWRWLLDCENTGWYPTMRLFRQPALGDWDGVFRQLQQAVSAHIAARHQ